MTDLSPEQQLFIVQRLGAYYKPEDIIAEFSAEYGVEISKQVVSTYVPGTVANNRFRQELRDEYFRVRRDLERRQAEIPVANAYYRKLRLQQLLDDPKVARNPKMVAEIVKLAEMIEGGVFQRQKKESTGAEGLKTLREYLGVGEGAAADPSEGAEDGV